MSELQAKLAPVGARERVEVMDVLRGFALLGILLILVTAFGSWRLAFLVLLTLPMALVGGVLAAVGALTGWWWLHGLLALQLTLGLALGLLLAGSLIAGPARAFAGPIGPFDIERKATRRLLRQV